MKKSRISNNVIRRLPRYIRHLDEMIAAGVVRASSEEIGRHTDLTASQVRQDFNCFGGFGQQGYGYNILELRKQLADIVGMNNRFSAIILGAGNLGRAIIGNFHFQDYGFNLKAAFDISPSVVGRSISGIPVYHMDTLESFLAENAIDVAILTVPGGQAEASAARVIASGVTGIWNFTNQEISSLPDGAIIEDVHFSDSLLSLSYYLTEARVSKKED